jgi:hypothetical protein
MQLFQDKYESGALIPLRNTSHCCTIIICHLPVMKYNGIIVCASMQSGKNSVAWTWDLTLFYNHHHQNGLSTKHTSSSWFTWYKLSYIDAHSNFCISRKLYQPLIYLESIHHPNPLGVYIYLYITKGGKYLESITDYIFERVFAFYFLCM